jgi:hypothetical protein
MARQKTRRDRTAKERRTQERKRTKGLVKKGHNLHKLVGVEVGIAVYNTEVNQLKTYTTMDPAAWAQLLEEYVG